ncbi:MAG: DSBA-like thioredoxin domain protein [bacterium ADurb.Bin374]|nr:MAG: DSBA-like thioredoxin domain protein [bacterium ADurb.Bin374]
MAADALTFYFDFTCPYSYIAWELLQRKRRQQPFQMKLIGIGPNPPGNPGLLGRELWCDARWAALHAIAEKLDFVINRPSVQASSQVALRGLDMYEGFGLTDYVSGVFKVLFRDNADISTSSELVEHLQANGIDTVPLLSALKEPETLNKVEDDALLWGHARIRTIPTLEFGNERLAGLFDQRAIENFLVTLDI